MFGLLGTVNRPNFEIGSSYYHQYLSLDRKRTLRIPAASSESTPPKLVSGMNVLTADGRTVKLNVLASGQARPKDPELLRRSLKQNSKSSVTKEKSWYYMQLPLGYSVLAGSLTLMLVVLPVVIISSQEALRAVPSSLRDGGLGHSRNHDGIHPCDEPGHGGSRPDLIGQQCPLCLHRPVQLDVALHDHASSDLPMGGRPQSRLLFACGDRHHCFAGRSTDFQLDCRLRTPALTEKNSLIHFP